MTRFRDGWPGQAGRNCRPKGTSVERWVGPILLLFCVLLTGCATSKYAAPAPARAFDFQRDTFAYSNELVWEYDYDAQGHWTTHTREPRPTYGQHCFVMARSAWQFFANARFDPARPKADEATYRRLIRRVVETSPRHVLPDRRKIIIPGYADLRSFSRDWEGLLKAQCGGAWQCYFQRGNWRMIFPLGHGKQEKTAERLLARLGQNQPAVVHVFRFPQLSINHAVLVFGASEKPHEIEFTIYDPNEPGHPCQLFFDRDSRTFRFPPRNYFVGGPLKVYEVYSAWDY
ncbi:MAG: hypothetical protein ACREIC_01915 [Limisphaerales bacterium]